VIEGCSVGAADEVGAEVDVGEFVEEGAVDRVGGLVTVGASVGSLVGSADIDGIDLIETKYRTS
jgi:hypothetical protein